MELKKWVFGTRLSQQITEQNANITEVDTKLGKLESKFKTRIAGYHENINFDDLVTEWAVAGGTNKPDGSTFWYVNTIQYMEGGNALQLAYTYTGTLQLYARRKTSGVWTAWKQLSVA